MVAAYGLMGPYATPFHLYLSPGAMGSPGVCLEAYGKTEFSFRVAATVNCDVAVLRRPSDVAVLRRPSARLRGHRRGGRDSPRGARHHSLGDESSFPASLPRGT